MRRKKKTRDSMRAMVTELDQESTDFLNYPGYIDDSDVVGQSMGPDRFGAYYQAVDAVYELATNSTRVGFRVTYRPGVGGRVRVGK